MEKIIISGLGAMGSSLAEKLSNSNIRVIGIDSDPLASKLALDNGIIDEVSSLSEKNLKDVDLIILASPVSSIIMQIEQLKKFTLDEKTIVMDIGSTKKEIMKSAQGLPNFVGGHPMIGTEKKGLSGLNPNMFENKPFFLIGDNDLTKRVCQLLTPLKASFQQLSSEEHDTLTGAISDLPHLVAFALVSSVDQMLPDNELDWQNRVAGGFCDTTRIAKANPWLWSDIISSNKDEVMTGLNQMIQILLNYRNDLQNDSTELLTDKFKQAQITRKKVGGLK